MSPAVDYLDVLRRFAEAGRLRDTGTSESPVRSMRLDVTDLGRSYHATLVGRHMADVTEEAQVAPSEGRAPDIVLALDAATLLDLFSGRLSPFVALSSRRARLDAPLRDMPRLRALFLGAGG